MSTIMRRNASTLLIVLLLAFLTISTVVAAATETAVNGASNSAEQLPESVTQSAASSATPLDGTFHAANAIPTAQPTTSRLAHSLRAYLQRSPLVPSSSAASSTSSANQATAPDPDESMSMQDEHPLSDPRMKFNALRHRGALLRKYGRLNKARIEGENPADSNKMEFFGYGDSVHLDQMEVDDDAEKLKQLQWNLDRSSTNKNVVVDEEELDALEWKVALQQATAQPRKPVNQQTKEALHHQFKVQSTSGSTTSSSRFLDPGEDLPIGLTHEQQDLADKQWSLLEPNMAVTNPLTGPATVTTSAPARPESRNRMKAADLQLPASQISQIILWTKQHIMWLIQSLGDHLPQAAVDAFPKPTRNELYGYVYALFIDPNNPNSWVDSMSNDFDDMLLLQVWQYNNFENFFDWIQISTVMFALREETNYPLSPIQKRRLWVRYTGLFKEDINMLNLGEEGELRRYMTWKWQLEYVGEVMSESDTEFYVAHLLSLSRKLRDMGIRDGLIRYYQAMFIEKLAKFRLDYTYDAAVEYFNNVYDVLWKAANSNKGITALSQEQQERTVAIKAGEIQTDIFDKNAWMLNTNETVIRQIEDMGLPLDKPFNPYTIPLNVLKLIEDDLTKLQAPAIESIVNYLQWHAKFHGNWQDEIDLTDQDISDLPSITDLQAGSTNANVVGTTTVNGVTSTTPTNDMIKAAAQKALLQKASAAYAAEHNKPADYNFRDVSMNDAEFGGGGWGMPGLVEEDAQSRSTSTSPPPPPSPSQRVGNLIEKERSIQSRARRNTGPTSAHDGSPLIRPSMRIGSFLESQTHSEQSKRDRQKRKEEYTAWKENEHGRQEFVEFRSQPRFPETKGREKTFAKQRGVDVRGVPLHQPIQAIEPIHLNTAAGIRAQPLANKPKARQFHVMSNGAAGSSASSATESATVNADVCSSYSVTERALLVDQLRTSLFEQVEDCNECEPSFAPVHHTSIDSLLQTLIPVSSNSTLIQPFDTCTAPLISLRLQSVLSALLFMQVNFLQPYYEHMYGGDMTNHAAFTMDTARDDLEFLTLFAVQLAQHHMHRPSRHVPDMEHEEWDVARLLSQEEPHMLVWCQMMYQLATSHPRTRYLRVSSPTASAGTGNDLPTHVARFEWRKLLVHVNEMLGWGWYQTPSKQSFKPHQRSRDLRLRHTTHVGVPLDGIVRLNSVETFGSVNNGNTANTKYNTTVRHAAANNGGRVLLSSSSPRLQRTMGEEADLYADSYSDGFESDEYTGHDSQHALLEQAPANLKAKEQLVFLLKRNNISSIAFDLDTYLQLNTVSAFQILSERLIVRINSIYDAFKLDDAKSWHSDRSKSPSAAYDFDPAIHEIDYLVWLDSMNYNPAGHLGLDTLALYNEENVQLINKKVSADDKYTRETHLRNQVETAIWLKDVSAFERWRWSWAYPSASGLLTPSQHIVFQWLEDWYCTSNIKLGAMTACISSSVWALLQIVRYLITKPWQRSSLVRNGSIHWEQKYHEEYEQRERSIVLYRILPIKIVTTYMGNFMLCTFVLALNFTYYNPLAMFFYLAIFRWLTSIIFDVYFVKFFMYLILFCFPKFRTGDLKPPLCACSIPLSSSIMILNPLRPANDDQLKQAVRKQIDLLWAASSQHIISILILQAEGNSTKTFRRYETIIRSLMYDDPDVPSHVKDRFFVFHVAEVTKPHNMFKVMHWMFMRSEQYDLVTRDFLFGCETSQSIAKTKKVIRRVPVGCRAPAFANLAGPKQPNKFIDEIDATGMELLDDQDIKLDAAEVKEEKNEKFDSDVKPPETKKLSLAERWKNFATGKPESTYESSEVLVEKVKRREMSQSTKTKRKKSKTAAKEGKALPNDDDFPDELSSISDDSDYASSVEITDGSESDEDEFVSDSEPDSNVNSENEEEDDVKRMSRKAKFHSTYEPLVYVGGNTCYKGYDDLGADSGILCTVQGLRNLTYFRNENQPGAPLLENFAVLDADNYVEPVTLLRMLATMTDDYMIWQPCIKFYNRDQSLYAYMKDFTNEHLGHFMNVANVWMLGGVRSFGKYFGRLKRFYYEECTAASCSTTPEQYSFMFNICSGLLTLCCIMYCIRPLGEIYMWLLFFITPVVTIGTCAVIWWTHRKLRREAAEVSASSDPNIGKGEDLIGFGPIQGDGVDGAAGRGRDRRGRRVAAALGDSRKVHSRFQNCFPLNRLFIQSEDSRHGGPFGRAVYLMDDSIHESTPISPLDDNHREFSKWLPTFDMRDFLLLHTPLLWMLQHLTISLVLLASSTICFAFIFIYSFVDNRLPSSLAQVWCFMLMVGAGGLWYAFYSIKQAMTEPVLLALRACRFPELPERALYAEELIIRGIWSETIWLMQFVLGIFCLLVPGTVEIAFAYMGEFHLLILLLLLIHPKFSAPLLTRMHFIFHPKWKGYWRSRAAVLEANEKAKKKGIKILMKKGKKNLLENAGYNAEEEQIVTIDEDGEQIVMPKATKSITVEELYEKSKQNNLTHTCLFETGHFNVCGRALPKWNKDKALQDGEKYSKMRDKDGYVRDTRFLFRLPNLDECGKKLDIDHTAMLKKQKKLAIRLEEAEAERMMSPDEKEARKLKGKVAFPLGAIDEHENADVAPVAEEADSSSSPATFARPPLIKARAGSATDSDDTDSAGGSSSDSDSDSESRPLAGNDVSSVTDNAIAKIRSKKQDSKPAMVPFPLAAAEVEESDTLKVEKKIHSKHLLQRAKTWNDRQYIIYREKRWQPICQLLFWLIHDIPVGIFEFTASTTVFGLKLLTKPPQVIWAMVGCCIEIKGLLMGIQTPGTWPSFVESTQTLPLSAYILEYHVPMCVSLILFFLCIPSMPTLLAQSVYFTNPWYLALMGVSFGALLGLWPAYNSFVKLRAVVTNKAAGGWNQLKQLRHFREAWTFVCAILMFGGVIFFSFSSWMLRGSFPAVFFIRSFPILIASFVLGPGIAWLLGMSSGVLDVSTTPPTYRRAYHSMLLSVGIGMFILSCAGMFVNALARVLLPLQRFLGNVDSSMQHSANQIPTGDGTMTVILPFSLTYGEMLKAPWYFVVPFACIVYGSMLMAVLAWPAAFVHQFWTWYHYWYKGGNEMEKFKMYQVDDIKQNLKEKKDAMDRLEKSGASRNLLAKLAEEVTEAEAAAASQSTLPIDRPIIDAGSNGGAGSRAHTKQRRGAVTLAI